MDSTEKVLQFIADSGMSDAQFTREAGLSNGLIGQWRSGKQKASLKNLQKIADRFKLDIGVLLGTDSARTAIDPQKAKIIEKISNLDVETLLKIEKIIDTLKGE